MQKRRQFPFALQVAAVASLSFAGSMGVAVAVTDVPGVGSFLRSAVHDAQCTLTGTVKGNVSYNNDERIYHVPGQRHYDETVIMWSRGERRFCTEAEARAAGWRKSGI